MGQPRGNDAEDPDGEPGSLSDLRREIEEIDEAIVDAVARRMYVVEDVAEVKDSGGRDIEDREREREVVDRAVSRAEELDVDGEGVRELFETLIEMSKRRQRSAFDDEQG